MKETFRSRAGALLSPGSLLCLVLGVSAACSAFAAEDVEARLADQEARLRAMEATLADLTEQLETLTGAIAGLEAREELAGGAIEGDCDTEFASGVYLLTSTTSFGVGTPEEYDLSHATMEVGEWRLNAGLALGDYGVPVGFYLDYDGDGRLDTGVTARLAREIPLVGNTLADRLLADSERYQRLYQVFGCEWQNAEFASADDITTGAADETSRVWTLLASNAEELLEWIAAEESADASF